MACGRAREVSTVNLLWKFNILLFVVFGLGLASIAFEAHSFLQHQAQEDVTRQAGLMAASAKATRTYTEQDVSPLLQKVADQTNTFLPETIPFFAATTTFQQLHQHYSDYTYKEAALNPTNPRDRATDWENDIINYFRENPSQTELVRTRDGATGPMLFLAHPIRTDQECMRCHSDPSIAPTALIRRYGTQNGFGWLPGEIVGAQIITVPTSLPEQMAKSGFRELMIDLALIFLASVVLIDAGLYFIIVRPLRRISANAHRVSQGELDLPQLSVRGDDEVARVTRSFNRMHTSLKKAMDLLNG